MDVGYFMWDGKDDIVPPGGNLDYSAIQGAGHFKFMIPTEGGLDPWLKAGAGAYRFNAKLEGTGVGDFDEGETNFGYNLGGGFQMAASPTFSWGVGALFHSIQEESNPVQFVTINLNIMFGMGGPAY